VRKAGGVTATLKADFAERDFIILENDKRVM